MSSHPCAPTQSVLKKGELQIRACEEEIRIADLQVAELCRDIEVTRRKLPKIPELEQQIVTLQARAAPHSSVFDSGETGSSASVSVLCS